MTLAIQIGRAGFNEISQKPSFQLCGSPVLSIGSCSGRSPVRQWDRITIPGAKQERRAIQLTAPLSFAVSPKNGVGIEDIRSSSVSSAARSVGDLSELRINRGCLAGYRWALLPPR